MLFIQATQYCEGSNMYEVMMGWVYSLNKWNKKVKAFSRETFLKTKILSGRCEGNKKTDVRMGGARNWLRTVSSGGLWCSTAEQLLLYLACGPTDAWTNAYLSPILLQTWLEDSISILSNLSLKHQSFGGTKQDRTSRNVRVISKVPPHSCYFMSFVFAWLETRDISQFYF